MTRCLHWISVVLALVVLAGGPLLAAALPIGPGFASHSLTLPGSVLLHGSLAWLLPLLVIGAIHVKDSATIAAKYATRAGAAVQDYVNGVQGAGAAWEQGVGASEANYNAGVQSGIGRGAFMKGVKKAGGAKYSNNAVKLGQQRYPQGVQNAQAAYQAGVTPYLQVIAGLNLPPRGPRRSPANQARANAVATALGAAKEGK